jgi:tetratricopeptide (TPR) repeat protein
MANISLRAYRREIEELIGHGRIDEVIAHCRHILKFYPKDVAIYRLLAKAYLESQRYSDATDIFQRVLSVVPDDFVAHVGMSIIREDEGNMDASIWHMERAFESQPSNTAIRDELRRLFGKRDGMEPPKIRLTRGALARMYAQGNLYQQSIGELRAALADEPQRFDLQVLLARMYYLNGQRVEAAEMSNTLISKLPFCLEANRILAEILYSSERANEAELYHQRVKVIDPYAAHASPDNLSPDDVPEDSVTLMRVDFQPGQELSELDSQPGWAASLGLDLGGQGTSTDALPDWLTDDEEDETEFMTDDSLEPDFLSFGEEDTQPEPVPPSEDQPEASMDFRDTLPPEAEPPARPPSDADELIPDWMKDAGWATSTGEAPEEAPAFEDSEEPDLETQSDELASAEIPDWLKDIAPADSPEGGDPIIQADDDMSGEIPSWLSSRPPGPTDSVVMWLQNKPEEEDLPPPTGDLEPPEPPAEPEEVPDWLQSVAASLPAVPAAPEEIESQEETAEETQFQEPISLESEIVESPLEEAEEPESETLDWMAAVETPAPDTIEDTKPRRLSEISEGEKEEEPSAYLEPEAAVEELASAAVETDEYEYVEQIVEEEIQDADEMAGEITAIFVQEDTETAEEEAAEPAGMFDETLITEPAYQEDAAAEPAEDLPDWLKEMDDEALAGEPAMVEETPSQAEEEDVPDWLLGLEQETGVAEPVFDHAEESPLEEPDAVPEGEITGDEEEVPDWLREMEQTIPSVEAPTLSEKGMPPVFAVPETHLDKPAAPEPEPSEPVPDWLSEEITDDHRVREEEAQPTSVDEDELAGALAGDLPSLEDQDAAIAWLESLAAKQGVAEEELVTDPEDRRDTPPDWITDSLSGLEDLDSMTADEQADIQPVMQEPLPDQPDWMTETLIGDTLVPDQDTPLFEEEVVLEEPAVEEWSLDTLDKKPEDELQETASEQPAETRRLEPETLEMPAMAAFQDEAEIAAEKDTFEYAEEITPDTAEEPTVEEPLFEAMGETQQFETEELAEAAWPAEPVGDAESEEEAPDWLEAMAEEFEPSDTLLQPAATRELDLERLTETGLGELAFEEEAESVESAEEPEELEPEWMRETGIPEAELSSADLEDEQAETFPSSPAVVDEPGEAVPEWMRETGVPGVVFESTPPDEPAGELDEDLEEFKPEWMLETALPSSKVDTELESISVDEEADAGLGAVETAEDWMLETALPEEFKTSPEEKSEIYEGSPEETALQPVLEPVRSDLSIQYEEMLAAAKSSLNEDEIETALNNYTRLIRRRRHLDSIIGDLQEATYRHPVNTAILETLGDAFAKSNRLQDALDSYSKAEDLLRS